MYSILQYCQEQNNRACHTKLNIDCTTTTLLSFSNSVVLTPLYKEHRLSNIHQISSFLLMFMKHTLQHQCAVFISYKCVMIKKNINCQSIVFVFTVRRQHYSNILQWQIESMIVLYEFRKYTHYNTNQAWSCSLYIILGWVNAYTSYNYEQISLPLSHFPVLCLNSDLIIIL